MADSAIQDLIVDLVAAIDEHVQRHSELLERVRAFRAELLGPSWDSALAPVSQPAPPLPVTPEPRLLPAVAPRAAPPAMKSVRLPPPAGVPVSAVPPAPSVGSAPQAPSSTSTPPGTPLSPTAWDPLPAAAQGLLHALKRDYDYFAELDTKLAALEAELASRGADGATGEGGTVT